MPLWVLILAYAAVTLVSILGVRLAVFGVRLRTLPETLLAAFFLSGAIGFALVLVPHALPDLPTLWHGRAVGISRVVLCAPAPCIALFTWLVFRSDRAWATVLALGLGCVTATVSLLGFWFEGLFGTGAVYWSGIGARAVCFAWACFEAVRYWLLSRKRLRLGLAEAMLTNRFLLWAIWSGAAFGVFAARVLGILLYSSSDPYDATRIAIAVSQIVLGVACSVAIWLTFDAPRFYRDWIERRAARLAA